jgi:hypothetical protein
MRLTSSVSRGSQQCQHSRLGQTVAYRSASLGGSEYVRSGVVLETTRAGFVARAAVVGASGRASVPTSMHRFPNLTLSVFADGVVGDSNATVCFVWCLASGIFGSGPSPRSGGPQKAANDKM